MTKHAHIGLEARKLATAAVLALAALSHPAMAQDNAIKLTSTVVEDSDDNRFFMRTGGIARDDVAYEGLKPGQAYTLVAQLYNVGAKEMTGEPAFAELLPEAASGKTSFLFPVPQNRTRFNIDYAVYLTLYDGKVDASNLADAKPIAQIRDTESEASVLQVHAIQRVTVTAKDAVDGDHILPGSGGKILAEVKYENLVEGYAYTLWGELMKTSGQSTGIYASIPEYKPKGKNGTLTMEFTVPEGFEGVELTPSVGLYHKKRVALGDNGILTILPDAPSPVMIASDPNLNAPDKTIAIGTLFEDMPAQ